MGLCDAGEAVRLSGMRGMVGSIGRNGGILPFVLTLLLLFRLFIPSGYMIAPDHDGRPGLVLCSAPAQPAEAPAHHDGHPADPAPSKPAEPPCAFAALGAPPLPPEPPALPPTVPAAAAAPDLPAGPALPLIAAAAPPPPATGPPVSV